jgi:D-psicose/D-tagatose/L-ribulose 3-epimerase
MKFGVNTLMWCGSFDNKQLKLIDRVAKMGFDGIELTAFDLSAVDAKATKAALDANGIGATLCAVMPFDGSGNLTLDCKDARQKGIDHVCRYVDYAAGIGAKVIAGPLYMHVGAKPPAARKPPQRTAKEWQNCVGSLRKAGAYAAKAGVSLNIEPLNRFEGYFLNTGEDTVKLCKDVGLPNVGYHYDTFHANIEEKDPVGIIGKAGKVIGHVHSCENDRGIPGTGHVDWKGVMAQLKKIKYDGWLVIESFVPQVPEIAAATCIWRPLAKNADELASKGLKFLKRMAK